MAAELLRRLAVPADEAVIVGDRLSTDVAMSRTLGMPSVLVLSGVTSEAEIADAPWRPDYVIDGIAALLPDDRDERGQAGERANDPSEGSSR